MKKQFWKIVTVSMVIVMLSLTSVGYRSDVTDHLANANVISDPIPSGEVWSENFDDGNVSDWHLYGCNHTANPDYLIEGNFSLDGGVLRAVGPEWNDAAHNSSVAYGTWSFDIDIQDPVDEWHFYVSFISEHHSERDLELGLLSPCYALGFYTDDIGLHEILLKKITHDSTPHDLLLDRYSSNSIIGWNNIIITRELSGQFHVYRNGALILEAKNSDYTTSERFLFATHANPAIDNITVSDTVDYDKAPPDWTVPLTHEIDEGKPFYYDVNATDHTGLDKWWIDDNENFTIDNDGVVTNNSMLSEDYYLLIVSVNDTLGYARHGRFHFTINPSTTTTSTPIPITTNGPLLPMELIAAAVGVSAVVILVLVILRKRR